MKKLLFALLILLATSAFSQVPDSTSVRQQLPADVQQTLLDIEKGDMDRRVEYMQHDQTRFLTILSIIVAAAIGILGVITAVAIFGAGIFFKQKMKSLNTDFKTLEDDYKSKTEELERNVNASKNSFEKTRLKLDNAVDEAVRLAVAKVEKQTEEKTEAFSTLVEKRMEDIQKAHNEINATKDKATKDADEVSRILKKIEESKGDHLTPQLQEEGKEQINIIEKEKDESEYTVNDWFDKGLKSSRLGHYINAGIYFEKANNLDPQKASPLYNWGNALSKLKQYEKAIEKYEKANKIDDKDIDIYCNWGNTLRKLERYDEAIEKFEIANKINKNDADIYCNWGIVLVKLKRYEEAIDKFEKAIETAPSFINPYLAWNITLTLLQLSSPDLYLPALQEFREVLEKNKDIPELKESKEFQEIYNKHFATEEPAEKPTKTSPKKEKKNKTKK